MKPPRFAVYLLTRIASGDEALVGDLVERFRQRPSRLWFWRQAIVAIASSTASDIRLHSLVAIRAAGLGCLSVWFFFTQVVVFTQVLGGGGGLDQWLFESGMARWPYLIITGSHPPWPDGPRRCSRLR